MGSVQLEVGIIGAGIAGLSAAIGLCRAGHNVEIFERSEFANEVGAAIHVCPNAARILRQWGFDFVRSKAMIVREGYVVDGVTLEPSYSGQYNHLVEEYGVPWYFIHRVDLHNELKRLAENPGQGFQAAKIRLAHKIKDVDCEAGTLVMPDGSSLQKDLIVAADGVHSTFTALVNGKDTAFHDIGQSAFRFLVPTKVFEEAGVATSLMMDRPVSIKVATGPRARLVWYPCRNGELQNFVGIHPDRLKKGGVEDFHVAAPVEDLLDEYKDFHPDIVEACRLAQDLNVWKLIYRPPIKSWFRGSLVLCGDAAHPMLPHQGQGGAQAIEDGGALGALFTGITEHAQIAEKLQMYQDVRQNRAAAIQILSNAGQDEAEKVAAEAQRYIKGKVPANQPEFHKFNFGHDVVAACKLRMASA